MIETSATHLRRREARMLASARRYIDQADRHDADAVLDALLVYRDELLVLRERLRRYESWDHLHLRPRPRTGVFVSRWRRKAHLCAHDTPGIVRAMRRNWARAAAAVERTTIIIERVAALRKRTSILIERSRALIASK